MIGWLLPSPGDVVAALFWLGFARLLYVAHRESQRAERERARRPVANRWAVKR